jgi:hypothetical protein
VISKHEQEPHFLLSLFKNIQKLDTPYLRQKFLIVLDALVDERNTIIQQSEAEAIKASKMKRRAKKNYNMSGKRSDYKSYQDQGFDNDGLFEEFESVEIDFDGYEGSKIRKATTSNINKVFFILICWSIS